MNAVDYFPAFAAEIAEAEFEARSHRPPVSLTPVFAALFACPELPVLDRRTLRRYMAHADGLRPAKSNEHSEFVAGLTLGGPERLLVSRAICLTGLVGGAS